MSTRNIFIIILFHHYFANYSFRINLENSSTKKERNCRHSEQTSKPSFKNLANNESSYLNVKITNEQKKSTVLHTLNFLLNVTFIYQTFLIRTIYFILYTHHISYLTFYEA